MNNTTVFDSATALEKITRLCMNNNLICTLSFDKDNHMWITKFSELDGVFIEGKSQYSNAASIAAAVKLAEEVYGGSQA